ncbi:MAG: hypothetical protein ACRCYP_03980 [Alphaproteobacteria bacterium]
MKTHEITATRWQWQVANEGRLKAIALPLNDWYIGHCVRQVEIGISGFQENYFVGERGTVFDFKKDAIIKYNEGDKIVLSNTLALKIEKVKIADFKKLSIKDFWLLGYREIFQEDTNKELSLKLYQDYMSLFWQKCQGFELPKSELIIFANVLMEINGD